AARGLGVVERRQRQHARPDRGRVALGQREPERLGQRRGGWHGRLPCNGADGRRGCRRGGLGRCGRRLRGRRGGRGRRRRDLRGRRHGGGRLRGLRRRGLRGLLRQQGLGDGVLLGRRGGRRRLGRRCRGRDRRRQLLR